MGKYTGHPVNASLMTFGLMKHIPSVTEDFRLRVVCQGKTHMHQSSIYNIIYTSQVFRTKTGDIPQTVIMNLCN